MIFKNVVSIPQNTPLIMGGRHQNVEDPITWTLTLTIRFQAEQ
jgi:hypothetical protein